MQRNERTYLSKLPAFLSLSSVFDIHQLFCCIDWDSNYTCAFKNFCRFFALNFCTYVMNMAHNQQLGKGKLLTYSFRCSWQACAGMSVCLGDVGRTPHTSVYPPTSVHHLKHLYTSSQTFVCTPYICTSPHTSVCSYTCVWPHMSVHLYVCMCPCNPWHIWGVHLSVCISCITVGIHLCLLWHILY